MIVRFVHYLEVFVHNSEVLSIYGCWQGAGSLSTVGRLSTLRSVHYRRFHCIGICIIHSIHRVLTNGTAELCQLVLVLEQ